MYDILKNIINSKTKIGFNKIILVRKEPNLLKWIDDNCHSDFKDINCPSAKLLPRKIWSCLHQLEPIKCPNGNWMTFYGYDKPLQCSHKCGCKEIERIHKIKETNLKKYGYSYNLSSLDFQNKIKQIHLNKRGVEYPMQSSKVKEKAKQINLEKYGCENISQSKIFKKKKAETTFKNYGVENPFQSEIIKDKIKETNLSKLGVEYPAQSSIVQNKTRQTNLEKYGVEYPAQAPMVQNKTKKTNLEKYGFEYPSQNQEIKRKKEKTSLKHFGTTNPWKNFVVRENIRKTNLKNLGVEYPTQSKTVRDKGKLTSFKNYGVPYPTQSSIVQNKTRQTNLEKYGVTNPSQAHITKENMEILNDPIKLKKLVEKEGIGAANILNIHSTTLYKYCREHNLNLFTTIKSVHETEIATWLTSLNINFQQSDRQAIKPYELDFYIPGHKLAIEFDGLYWHSELQGKDKNYHIDKTKKCQEQGIHLVHIFEDEWRTNKEICKSIILGHLNLITNKIAARKCQVVEINNIGLRDFMNLNHLQGHTNGSLNLVLLYNLEIVAAMTFGRPRYNKQVEYELLRLVTKNNVNVQGGAQKLWCHFLKNYNPTSIVSYCDRRWFNGDIYNKLGFKLKNSASPTYWYTDFEKRYHRSRFTKKNCVKEALKLEENILNENELNKLTEKIITQDILMLDRIWDCGQDTWIWNKE